MLFVIYALDVKVDDDDDDDDDVVVSMCYRRRTSVVRRSQRADRYTTKSSVAN